MLDMELISYFFNLEKMKNIKNNLWGVFFSQLGKKYPADILFTFIVVKGANKNIKIDLSFLSKVFREDVETSIGVNEERNLVA